MGSLQVIPVRPKSNWCSYERHGHAGEKPRKVGGRDWRDVATSPGPGRGRREPPREPLGGAWPCPAWISDFRPQN